MPHFIDVILPIPVEKCFSYRITEAEAGFLKPGMRVAVPFGKSKIYTALVFKIHNNPPLVYEAKEIHQILDESPIVVPDQLKFWEWIASYYMCALGDVMRAALPNAFLLESETIINRRTDTQLNEIEMKDDEFMVWDALQHQSSLRIQDVMDILDKKSVLPVIKRLLEREAVEVQEEVYEKYKPKLVRNVRLNEAYNTQDNLNALLDELGRAHKQRDVVMHLFMLEAKTKKPVSVKDLHEVSKASSAIIKSLIDKGILEEYFIRTDRVNFLGDNEKKDTELSEYQQKAFEEIKDCFDKQDVCLLHGVTSSGKTEVYVKLIAEVLDKGKQVLYLLPEIALTTQLINRLQAYFGGQVSVFHSKYSAHERIEVWNNVLEKKGKAKVILGARSALFLPFTNLGLVIVDEEHEHSFKQFDPAPRYHARDAAIVLSKMQQAKILLGSATPSLESYHNATSGKYGLVEITRRYNDVLMPDIELVDIKDKYKRKRMVGHFSDRLIEEMQEALGEGFQVILFQNRRGFSPVVECQTCGHAPQCPNCDVSLTYHQHRQQLRCHYCSYTIILRPKCDACGCSTLDTKGFGTEQIQEEVKELFPEKKVARMDFDTTRGKYSYDKIISSFEQGEVDILVGTQMLTKGLDFGNVKLVGIMNADNLLNFPDFRAHERSFQMLQQVSGRAGRAHARGKVIVQTYNPYHNILQQVSTNAYGEMYKEQMEERFHFKYPPIYRLVKITLRHRDYNRVNTASEWMAKSLRQIFKAGILGPVEPPVSRIRNQYHRYILIKIHPKQSLAKTKEAIVKVNNSFESVKDFKPVKVIINVDSY
ncbi:replication restart helicase PriA [Mangrovimonas aestuarii]|uniref:replication restart helicase PriA n=1 Tax=Mangrovimonas aestuarii TaxID=3018443 RepID=UPI002378D421|nr:primosomal protein N' [Mangrovimonas aestuarii]